MNEKERQYQIEWRLKNPEKVKLYEKKRNKRIPTKEQKLRKYAKAKERIKNPEIKERDLSKSRLRKRTEKYRKYTRDYQKHYSYEKKKKFREKEKEVRRKERETDRFFLMVNFSKQQ